MIVLDSFGIGELPDAADFGDTGSDTLGAIVKSRKFNTPNLQKLGLFNIEGVQCGTPSEAPQASFARMAEQSAGKDTTIGHWEIAGVISKTPLPTYPSGFPDEVLDAFKKLTGRGVLCNKPYSGTKVIMDYGRQHVETGDLIVYTSADSVFQIAAHEDVVPVEKLYEYCEAARLMLKGKHAVGRVIARPFTGEYPDYTRTTRRHDFSLKPPADTMLDVINGAGLDSIAVGKIYDIFAGRGITEFYRTTGNHDGMNRTLELQKKDFHGLCFVNLVDFDMLYGHRNDVDGYAAAMTAFDESLEVFLDGMRDGDVLLITADHGCDPSTPSTDHSREYTPMIITGRGIKHGEDLKTRNTFSDIAATVLDLFGLGAPICGSSFKNRIIL